MKRNAMRRNLRQSILKSFGRYIAIVLIIALGAGLFVGLLMTKSDMVVTGQRFIDRQNMFDLRMVSNYGWTEEYVEEFSKFDGVTGAEGLVYMDFIARLGSSQDDSVFRLYGMPDQMNLLSLRSGRMPEKPDECLADGFFCDDSILGQTITISDSNEKDSLESLKYKSFTVVGYVATPLYMDMNRGTTSVGSGSLQNYFYIPMEAYDVDYYSEINLTIDCPGDIYSAQYNDAVDAFIDTIEEDAKVLSQRRYEVVMKEVEEEYAEGYQEYLDGVKEFEEGKAEAEQELADARKELEDGEAKLVSSKRQLQDAEYQIEKGRDELQRGWIDYASGEAELRAGKSNAETMFSVGKMALDAAYERIQPDYEAAQTEISSAQAEADRISAEIDAPGLEASITSLERQIEEKSAQIAAAEAELEALRSAEEPDYVQILALEQELLQMNLDLSDLRRELTSAQASLTPYTLALAEVEAVKSRHAVTLETMDTLQAGYAELEAQKASAEAQLAEAEVQLKAGRKALEDGEKELDWAYKQMRDGWEQYYQGQEDLEEGWIQYEEGKLEAEQKIADAEQELADAKQELADARQKIDDMDEPDLIILDRSSNVGYNNLDSSSDIVQGVSRVFPVFFLLVASLVCITTMTRMIDEERTQIGTLKALGYSNAAIMNKYLFYSGSAALLGCGLGLLAGSTIFPQIIWQAYCIMLYITPDVVLTVNWPLCLIVTAVYAVVLMLVTWYSCRRALREEPAELIRPKSPDPGKKILLEYLPIWKRVSFLNKVTIRNIFRYKQRLAMMLVGIGGCTALLVTGFGLRDSIVNVVDYQFEEVTLYDMEVYFRDELTEKEQERFRETLNNRAQDYMFYHQSSVELSFEDTTKEIYMICADSGLAHFVDLHNGGASVPLPKTNEVVLSIGVAEAMGIGVGDSVIMRNADMQILELTVSGIYENHVYNYAIVAPETIEAQWGEAAQLQMAFVKVRDGQDIHSVSADITDLYSVMNVAVSSDNANMVKGMMDALDLVVIVIVFCAGLLAVIVLYNLTNINITERIREIATIKVLGFNASETGAYVFKENLVLTVAGAVFGLGLGKLLLLFVMSQIKIDMVWFKAMVEPVSYVLAIVLTLLSAIVVDFIFYFKLDKINMAEALKSVE